MLQIGYVLLITVKGCIIGITKRTWFWSRTLDRHGRAPTDFSSQSVRGPDTFAGEAILRYSGIDLLLLNFNGQSTKRERASMNRQSGTERSLAMSYLGLRRAIGFIGIFLPLVLASGKIFIEGPGIQGSISAYYYTVR
jgi:hypothetical protein